MAVLQVRRLGASNHPAVPKGWTEELCELALNELHRQELGLLEYYTIRRMPADGMIKRSNGSVFLDGNRLVRRYADGHNPYLFFTPRNTVLAAGPEHLLLRRECAGYGKDGVAIVDLDNGMAGFHSRVSVNYLLHELGHSVYRLRHHRSGAKVCSMNNYGKNENVLHYCLGCRAKARRVEKELT